MVEKQWCDITDGCTNRRPAGHTDDGLGGLIHDPLLSQKKRGDNNDDDDDDNNKKNEKIYLSIYHKVRVNQKRYKLTKIGTR